MNVPGLASPVDALDHSRGPARAPVTLVEYGDYQCRHCWRAHGVLEDLVDRVGDGMRFVFRHFPLVDLHPHAWPAALAAEAAADADRFWVMHALLFSHQDRLAEGDLAGYARRLGLRDAGAIGYRAREHHERVKRDLASGEASGVAGTPVLFLNGRRYRGPVDLDSLTEAVRDTPTG
ncbi:DsbA family protein [Pseudonocardia hydrocarbonoxydans]|uniref:Thioredoxin domain-containing protein n=1 Tax=Pseudonocardia hydrocarbonoxydans TaxID=76726 RepID=A0A4Y3WM60_9PSEU|nr:DsbA family protein [Pseudonocardia hydrocarbonoxydans]GEC20002.1 hypothetical protein PHY01_22850 [Pseudonocardia hydrocarbonoxydans]